MTYSSPNRLLTSFPTERSLSKSTKLNNLPTSAPRFTPVLAIPDLNYPNWTTFPERVTQEPFSCCRTILTVQHPRFLLLLRPPRARVFVCLCVSEGGTGRRWFRSLLRVQSVFRPRFPTSVAQTATHASAARCPHSAHCSVHCCLT